MGLLGWKWLAETSRDEENDAIGVSGHETSVTL
jgi:hypothetical protein